MKSCFFLLLSFSTLFATNDQLSLEYLMGQVARYNVEKSFSSLQIEEIVEGFRKNPPMTKEEKRAATLSKETQFDTNIPSYIKEAISAATSSDFFFEENKKNPEIYEPFPGIQYRIIQQGNGNTIREKSNCFKARLRIFLSTIDPICIQTSDWLTFNEDRISDILFNALVGIKEGEKRIYYFHPTVVSKFIVTLTSLEGDNIPSLDNFNGVLEIEIGEISKIRSSINPSYTTGRVARYYYEKDFPTFLNKDSLIEGLLAKPVITKEEKKRLEPLIDEKIEQISLERADKFIEENRKNPNIVEVTQGVQYQITKEGDGRPILSNQDYFRAKIVGRNLDYKSKEIYEGVFDFSNKKFPSLLFNAMEGMKEKEERTIYFHPHAIKDFLDETYDFEEETLLIMKVKLHSVGYEESLTQVKDPVEDLAKYIHR